MLGVEGQDQIEALAYRFWCFEGISLLLSSENAENPRHCLGYCLGFLEATLREASAVGKGSVKRSPH